MSLDTESDIMLDNALIDAEELAKALGREFTDGDVTLFTSNGINLFAAAKRYAQKYEGSSEFMLKLRSGMENGKTLTTPQVRVVCNIIREHLTGRRSSTSDVAITEVIGRAAPDSPETVARDEAVRSVVEAPVGSVIMDPIPTTEHAVILPSHRSNTDPREDKEYPCSKCGTVCKGITAIYEHQIIAHKGEGWATRKLARISGYSTPNGRWDPTKLGLGRVGVAPIPTAAPEPDASVIAVTTSTLNLDISGLPDGRYAAPDPTGKNDFVFLMVKRVKNPYRRNRRYRWSKFRYGWENVAAGTIEVKEWTSDAKRLLGEQKVNPLPFDPEVGPEVYRGEFEEELKTILANPEGWAKVFAREKKRCYMCGKSLTDLDSRLRGVGPDCAGRNTLRRTA